jgi:hypothetical protein
MLSARGGSRRGRLAGAVALALCGLTMAGCSGGDESSPSPEPSSTAPGGLTAPGTNLSLGDVAAVALKDGKRKSNIKVRVVGVQTGNVDDLREFDLNNAARQSGVYYVRAVVQNVGHGDLGGAFVKLYAKVSDTLVVQPVLFGSSFGKCNYRPLPKPFKAGKRADVCMVMLAPRHGSVSAVEWRFAGDQPPISWELS